MEPISDCVEYTLGPAALDFIKKERLAVGRTLARLLLDTLDLDSGRVSVFFPPGLSLDRLQEDFEAMGMLPFPPESEWIHHVQDDGRKVTLTPIPEANSDLFAIALRHVRANEEHLCILEDPSGEAGPWKLDAETRVMAFKDGEYHVIQGRFVDQDYVEKAVRDAKMSWQMIGALTSLRRENAITARQRKLTLKQLRLMAQRTVKLFTVAYDGEGYLIWHRAEIPEAVDSDKA